MLLLPPTTYARLKNDILHAERLTHFDKKMVNILKNNNLSESDKWLMYRQELMKQRHHLRNQTLPKINPLLFGDNHDHIGSNASNALSGKRRQRADNFVYETKATQTKLPPMKIDKHTQRDESLLNKSIGTQATPIEIFESIGELGSSQPPPPSPTLPIDDDFEDYNFNDNVATNSTFSSQSNRRMSSGMAAKALRKKNSPKRRTITTPQKRLK